MPSPQATGRTPQPQNGQRLLVHRHPDRPGVCFVGLLSVSRTSWPPTYTDTQLLRRFWVRTSTVLSRSSLSALTLVQRTELSASSPRRRSSRQRTHLTVRRFGGTSARRSTGRTTVC